ncbi:hypothetical protein D1867_12150 [Acidianus infernus]|uniref:PKD domain-containing protein n=1 Tax=Acidianus infernus TaxID=12915 RepID=A0A6A9QJI0_ACIIN|nr:PKD domain-containing protein [Acidianus infernus]MUM65963.1 hypothetical protein [Acidianus infernus]
MGKTYYCVKPNITGEITYPIKVEDVCGNVIDLVYSLKVNPDPVVIITPSRNATDVGIPISFNATVIGGTKPYIKVWYVNGTPVSNEDVLYYNFTSPGVYNVTLKVVDSVNFTAVNSVTIKVNDYPTLNVSYNLHYDFLVYASSVNLSSKVFGGTPPYTYTVYVNGREYYVGNNLSINVPIDAGKNNITVVVKDSLGLTKAETILVYGGFNWFLILVIITLIVVITIILMKRRR